MTALQFKIYGILLGCYVLLMAAMFSVAWVRALAWRRRTAAAAAVQPKIRETLVDYLAGSNDLTRIRALTRQNRGHVADGMFQFRSTVGGATRDRLCQLSLELSLLHDWCKTATCREMLARRTAYHRISFVCSYEPCRRVAGDYLLDGLQDRDPEILLASSRALIQSGQLADVERVFRFALHQNLFIRILLAEDLRRFGMDLCREVIPEILHSDDYTEILGALEIMVAWERALPIERFSGLMDHNNRDIRMQALRLSPLIAADAPERSAVLCALDDTDDEIAAVAASAAGRMHLEKAMPALARCLRRGSAELARAAAIAMASMPPVGWSTLEDLSKGPDAVSAGIARDALESARRREAA